MATATYTLYIAAVDNYESPPNKLVWNQKMTLVVKCGENVSWNMASTPVL